MEKKVNPNARIIVSHSERGLTTIETTWATIGFEWLGPKNPILPKLLKSLHETGNAQVTDESGTTFLRNLDPMYL